MNKIIVAAAILATFQIGATTFQKSEIHTNINFELHQYVDLDFEKSVVILDVDANSKADKQYVELPAKLDWSTSGGIKLSAICSARLSTYCDDHGYIAFPDFKSTGKYEPLYEKGSEKEYILNDPQFKTFKGIKNFRVGIAAAPNFIKDYDHNTSHTIIYAVTIELTP
ncbi:hypothetical protein [Photobacterium profundum]|uniref:Uncharacterized protein n=1 Tax=Photobacterium profundum (strain SS9) TaxID=298386 RepID=Q6LFW2_PHOPR|nr:hypothetical protein [Photobacterium profundum]CAG23818.1 hypothetical protein PBPRB1973 [Photobacterium profundum SS9]